MPIVEVPGVGPVEFPDNMSNAEIQAVVADPTGEKRAETNRLAEAAGGGLLGDVARTALGQGLALGFGDEITAGAKALFTDQSYEDALKEERAAVSRFKRDNPYTAFGLELAGGLGTGGLAGLGARAAMRTGANMVTRPLAALAGTGGRASQAARIGAAEGAVAGAGAGTDLESRLTGAALGGGLGAAGGAALGGLGDVVAASRQARQAVEAPVSERTTRALGEALESEGLTVDQAISRAQELSRDTRGASALADLGDATVRMARGAAATPGGGSSRATKFFRERSAADRARVMEGAEEALGTNTDAFDFVEDVVARRKQQATPLYETAMPTAVPLDDALTEVMNRGIIRNRMGKARPYAGGENVRGIQKQMEAGQPYTLQELHAVQQMLSDTAASAGKKKFLGKKATEARNDLMDILRRNPAYAQATDLWSEGAGQINAVKLGEEIFKKRPRILDQDISRLPASERDALRVGIRSAIFDKIQSGTWNANAARQIFRSPKMDAQLKAAFGADYPAFKRQLNAELLMQRTSNAVIGGSPTARIQQDIQRNLDLDPLDFIDLLTSGGMGTAARMGSRVFREAMGRARGQERSDEMARMLFDPNLGNQIDALRAIGAQQQAQQARRAAIAGDPVTNVPIAGLLGGGAGTIGAGLLDEPR